MQFPVAHLRNEGTHVTDQGTATNLGLPYFAKA